ncbi:MAG TPA: O-antigen ligase family protein, partial [Candidatus Eisenbacteria bacterium]|nr:O-antigen ligase family protein [Candidatus Eisenbacteria bacterium]
LYLGWAAFTVTQAVDQSVALFGLKPYLVFFLAFWTGSRILGTAHLRPLLRVYAWITIGIALETLGVAIANGVPFQLLTRQMGTFTDLGWGRSNYVAAVAALSTAAVLPLMFQGKGTDRRLAIASLVAAAFVAIVSASRGGTVAVLLSLVLVLTKDRLNVFLTLAVLGAAGAFLFFSPMGQEHFLGPKGLPSIGARILFFRETLRIAFEHPWIGIGPDQIPFHTYFYMDANPHNIFLKQAADLGVIGLGLFVLLLGLVVKGVLAVRQAARQGGMFALRYTVLLLVFLTAVTNASYEPTLEAPQYGFLFWLLVGTLLPVERPHDASMA